MAVSITTQTHSLKPSLLWSLDVLIKFTSVSLMFSAFCAIPSKHWDTIGSTSRSMLTDFRMKLCKKKSETAYENKVHNCIQVVGIYMLLSLKMFP